MLTSFGCNFYLFVSRFVEVGELVGTEQYLSARRYFFQTGIGYCTYLVLHGSFYDKVEEALFFGLQKYLPSLFGYFLCKSFYIIRTSRYVYDLVEVRLFFEQQLLVFGYSLGKLVGSFVRSIKRRYGKRVYTCYNGTHSLRLRTQQIDVCIEYSHIEQ